jgi:hypothetical protein
VSPRLGGAVAAPAAAAQDAAEPARQLCTL